MRKKWKKVMAGTLSVCMLATSVSGVIEFGGYEQFSKTVQAATSDTVSGTCGENAKWKYNRKTKTLTISGTGAMTDYASSFDWESYIGYYPRWKGSEYTERLELEKVVIGDGITKIGNYAFNGFANLKQVKIGKKVKSIGTEAFADCEALTTIKTGDGVQKIGKNAFLNCSSLSKVTLGKNVTKIGKKAFSNTALKEITFGKKVKEIGVGAFSHTSVKEIKIGNNIETIGNNAFEKCAELKKVTLGNKVKEIGSKAFYKCEKLTTVSIGKVLKTIGSRAFDECYGIEKVSVNSNNTNLVWKENVLMNKGKTKLYMGSFVTNTTCNIDSSATEVDLAILEHPKVEQFEVSSENKKYYSEDGMLYSKDGTALLVCPRGKKGTAVVSEKAVRTDYDYYSAIVKACPFKNCANLEKIIIGKNVQHMDSQFKGCNSLKEIEVDGENKYFSSAKGSVLSKEKDKLLYFVVAEEDGSYTVPAGVASIDKEAFSGGVEKPKHIILSDEVSSFIDVNFEISSITLGKNFKDISNIFWVDKIYVSENNLYYSMVDGIFYNKEQTELVLIPSNAEVCKMPQTVTKVAEDALGENAEYLELKELYVSDAVTDMRGWLKGDNLEKIHIGKSVRTISPIYTKNLNTITVSAENESFKAEDNVLYSKDGEELIWCPQGKTGTVTVCSGTAIIAKEAFKNAENVNRIVLPSTMKAIETNAFSGVNDKAVFVVPKGMKKYYEDMLISEVGFNNDCWNDNMTIEEME